MTTEALRHEVGPKRVRGFAAGELVFDTTRPLLVWEIQYYPAYYVAEADLRLPLSPEGELIAAGRRIAEAAVRHTEGPLAGYVRFRWDALDEWLEEDEPIYGHPRDPYKRVDILRSSRHVRVLLDGVTLANTHRPTVLYETGLPARFYIPIPDLRQELLVPSETTSLCPYKGWASYWHLVRDGQRFEDFVWCYRSPFAESQKIAGLASFYNEKVDLLVDGELLPRPQSPFSD
ncbi:hypothetical protein Val02_38600 [Virgisporangium aliadipatigenens]|uniref:DUF427 domain-containing protein n=1 Tax=Virgisporangium aliadipatigenens TaxID=741659 RepID=A0A8J4DQV0_9ACTN|nr:DUF427 domain-containing protein [Virgisporangium aliadipatigenens]GIJ46974.1 hypothetical protein Val02_38600 [Virgisporangium aliadipatigenens]